MSLFAADAAKPGLPFWWEDGLALPDLPSAPPEKTEFLVIGAGFTGLSAALVLADEGAEVTVIDAAIPGQGASTRNGGMFGAHPRLAFDTLVKRFGEEAARGLTQEAPLAFNFTRELIEREKIACGFEQTGRVQMAWTRADFEAQRRQFSALSGIADLGMALLDREALAEDIKTDLYFGGLRFKDHAALQPRKFHDGLLAAALARGVKIVQNCAAREVKREGAAYLAQTVGGDIRARKVILATNGYTSGAFGWFQRRVFPLPSYLIASEILPEARLAELAPGKRMMVETRARHSYFRLSPDGRRMIFGGRAAIRPIAPELAAGRLFATMTEVWPSLRDVKLTHVWSGNTGYTFSHMPHLGVRDGVYFALGYSGSGVALAPYLGMKLGFQALGDARGASAYSQTTFAPSWLHPGSKPYFLHGADFWYQTFVDRWQNMIARHDRSN